ncbi:[FeFe] hydrogenase H-cluster maturation GTPase HydF [Aminicella lysinilytica]|uniref:[FeFe] hydrogenase H-cluster maturation GTPase HydF n=1 Tax=Aminicella lysinilytica TaxID=433323 RepID=A0A4R6QDG8_9FIRM|nr:[FeFe] hydrogenase H-cluster maturation GTPase HydF [Aminicella lysinilytica]TDP60501.1 [FeFe] hydrogenase H-cluster maturation GTPase HydF [Aminicella lysinilytica]
MSLNDTPSGERIHIGFFGRRNAGKSSIVNRVTGQRLSVVSPQKGTTTDPVYKAMELLPLGSVMIIDTPGFDDEGALGGLRVEKAKEVLGKTDIAVLVVDGSAVPGVAEVCDNAPRAAEADASVAPALAPPDRQLIEMFRERQVPYIIVFNKMDLAAEAGRPVELQVTGRMGIPTGSIEASLPATALYVSARTDEGITELKERLAQMVPTRDAGRRLVGDLINQGDQIVLVIPIDESAPKGRLILPQQQVIRDILEAGATVTVARETELVGALNALRTKPSLVITDSQAFHEVAEILPADMLLTSFSILMARYKGFLDTALAGVDSIEGIRDGDRVLVAEGCTHHRQCNDIGTVKIPRWLKAHTGRKIIIETVSGRDFPSDLSDYKVVIHCGGCMLNEREVVRRRDVTLAQNIPFINYGVLIAYMNGILQRSIAPLGL